jgi:hypothetical protein
MGTFNGQQLGTFSGQGRVQDTFQQTTTDIERDSPTRPMNQEQRALLRQEINSLLAKRAIEPAARSLGFMSSMFVIPKWNGGYRPVFNLKALNQHVIAPHFKMETIQQVTQLIQRNDYLTSIDITDAFLHILVHRNSRKYLRFHWEGESFQFRTTPFGLSVVPWVFTRLTKPVLT